MPKVITFTSPLSIFKTAQQLFELDEQVNNFLREQQVSRIHSVSDATTADDKGATIGIIRVVAYD